MRKSIKISFLFIIIFLRSYCGYTQSVSDRFVAPFLHEIRVEGYLGKKIDACIIKRVKAQDIHEVIDPFRHREETRYWQTEFWGKWITSAISACEYTGDNELRKIIDDAFTQLIKTQSPDGYIGNYSSAARLKQWDVWGRKYTLLGLIAYYDLCGEKKAFNTAKKLLDFTMTEIGPGKTDINKTGNYRGMASGSILEPVVLLYNRTGEKKYLDFANYIAGQWEIPDGPQLIPKALDGIPVAERFPVQNESQWWTWDNGQKAYEMMSCYEGLIELYRVTGEKKYLMAVEAVVKNIIEDEINICGSGAAMECWYHGRINQAYQSRHAMETCVTMTWMKLLLNLYRTTDKAEYIDQFEISMYNALLASLHPDANTFSKYTPLCGYREEGLPQPGMTHLHCCMGNGPRALMLIPAAMIMKSEEGVVINLFSNCKYKTTLPDKTVLVIVQSTQYPKTGEVSIQVDPERQKEFTISLRIPAWSKIIELKINHKEIPVVNESGYVKINRLWSPEDKINFILDMPSRVIFSPDGSKHFAAIIRGPVVLVRDSQNSDGIDTDELVTPVLNQDNSIDLVEVPHSENIWMAFGGQFYVGSFLEGQKNKPITLTLCDFASAGYGWKREARYRVWLPQLLDPSKK